MAAPKTQVNSATGIMAPSGMGKSSLLATLAKHVYRKWGKITLYYACDGGGFPAEVQACIAAGIMRVFRMYTRDPGDGGLAFETCQRACQGWWPKRINPATGEVQPGVEMVPPVVLRYEMRCPSGHLMKTVPSESLLQPGKCPECGAMVTKLDMKITKSVTRNRGFEDVGAVAFDGLTSMLAWEMRELGHRAGRLELKGEEAAIGGKVVSGDLKFGGSTRSHVGFVQARGEELVHVTLGIPNLVVPPVFTMLTHEDVDDRSLSIRGPKIMGRAKTDEAPQWFGNLLEASKIPALQGTGEQRILYLSEFTDAQGVRHLCKHRGSPGTMPAYLIDPAEGETDPTQAFTQFNLGVFFELLESALDRRIADVMAEFPNAPGVPEGIVEVGDNRIELPAAAAPVAVVGPQEGIGGVPASAFTQGAPAPKPRVRKPAAAPAGVTPAGVTLTTALIPVPGVTEMAQTPSPLQGTPLPPVSGPTRPVAPPAGMRPGTPPGLPLTGSATPAGRAVSVTLRPPAAAPVPPKPPVSVPVPPSSIGDRPQ